MRFTNKILACLLAVGWLSVAGNATVSAASFHEACRADIRHFCDTVTAGHGRLMACIYAHEDKVSEACDEASSDVGNILDTVFAKVEQVLSECRPDIEKYCTDKKFGDGAILTCLNQNSASLAEPCKNAVPDFVGDLSE